MEIARLYATLGADVTGFQNGMKKMESDLSFAQKGVEGLERAVTVGLKAAVAVAVTGVTALGGALAGATKSAISFEQGIADITAVMRLSKEETRQMGDLIKSLAISPHLKVSATEASAAIAMLGKNGLALEQIMGGAAESTIKLANATGSDFGLAADIVTDAMALFSVKAPDMEKAVAGIVSVTQQSKFSMDDYRYALANAAPVLSSMGVEFNEFNALLTASASGFASGMTAGTSWRMLMQNLVPATDAAAKKMQELGFITEDGKNQFFDANGELREATHIVRLLQSGFGGLSAEQTTAYARAIFGQEALGALNATMSMSVDELAQMIETQSDVNALNEAAAARIDTVSGAWEIFKSVVEGVGIQIGEIFLPYLKSILQWATDFVSTHAPGVVTWFENLAATIDLFGARIKEGDTIWDALRFSIAEGFNLPNNHPILQAVDFLEQLTRGIRNFFSEQQKFTSDPPWLKALMSFGDFARPIINYVWELITGFFKLSDVFVFLGAIISSIVLKKFAAIAVAAAPVIAVAAALVLAVATLRTAWEENWWGIQERTAAAIAYLTSVFTPLYNVIRDFGAQALSEIVAWVTGNETQFNALRLIWEVAKLTAARLFNDLVALVRGYFPDWNFNLGEWAKAAIAWIEEAVPQAVAWVGKYINDLVTQVYVKANTWQIALIAWQRAAIEWIETAIPLAVAKLGEWGTAVWGWLTENLPIWRENLGTWGADMSQWISDTFEPTITALGQWGVLLWGWLQEKYPEWSANLSEWQYAAYRWIELAIPQAVEAIRSWGEQLWGWVSSNLPEWTAKINTWRDAAIDWVKETFQPTQRYFNEYKAILLFWLHKNLPEWVAKLGEWAAAAWTWIKDTAIPNAVAQITQWRDDLFGYVNREKSGWTQRLSEWGKAAWEWLKDVIPTVIENIGQWRATLFTFLTNELPNFVAIIGEWAVALITWIGETIPDVIREFGDWLISIIQWNDSEATPGFIAMIMQWVAMLWRWVMDDLWPALYPALIDLGMAIVETLGKVGLALFEMIRDVWVPVMWRWVADDAWPKVVSALAALGQKILDDMRAWATGIYDALRYIGTQLVEGFRQGVNDRWNNFMATLNSYWNAIPQGLRTALGIRSPSTVFYEIGDYAMQGLANGINDGFKGVTDALSGVIMGIKDQYGNVQNALNHTFTVPGVTTIPVAATMKPTTVGTGTFTGGAPPLQAWTDGTRTGAGWPDWVTRWFGGNAPTLKDAAKLPAHLQDAFKTAMFAADLGVFQDFWYQLNEILIAEETKKGTAITQAAWENIGDQRQSVSAKFLSGLAQSALGNADVFGWLKSQGGSLVTEAQNLANLGSAPENVATGSNLSNLVQAIVMAFKQTGNQQPQNNITVNVNGQEQTMSVAYMVEYLNAMLAT